MSNDKTAVPRPAVPFSFTSNSAKALAESFSAEDSVPQKEKDFSLELIAMLYAKGVGYGQIVELIPEARALVESVKASTKTGKLVNSYSARLNEGVESRIKKATQLALDKIVDILLNPKSTPKDILSAARDLLDRDLGKATQRVDIGGSLSADEDYKSLISASAAAEERIKAMLDKQEAVRAALALKKQPILIEAEEVK